MFNDGDVLLYNDGYDAVIIEPTNGTMDSAWRAKQRDGGGLGVGDSKLEAILSMCRSMRRQADAIEKLAREKYS